MNKRFSALAAAATMSTVAMLLLVTSTTALADAGPHQGSSFGSKPDACAGCHRIHTAQGPRLLKESTQAGLCLTCHDGTGATTNVVDGIYTVNNQGLRGGGFTNALMDPDLTWTPVSAATTSTHTVDGTSATAWGGGAISGIASYGTTITLECGNCHNPHGNGQYRILRRVPNEGYGSVEVTLPEQPGPPPSLNWYYITYDEFTGYRQTSYVPENMEEWCSQCHTRYLADVGSGSNPSADAIFSYRHWTDGVVGGCLKCHVAHGTTATMGSFSGAALLPNGAAGGGSEDSRLLHVSNRGVCGQCHTRDSLTSD